jgi:hypothetical protein
MMRSAVAVADQGTRYTTKTLPAPAAVEAAALDGDSDALARLGDLAERQAAQRRMLPLRQPERTYALLIEAADG